MGLLDVKLTINRTHYKSLPFRTRERQNGAVQIMRAAYEYRFVSKGYFDAIAPARRRASPPCIRRLLRVAHTPSSVGAARLLHLGEPMPATRTPCSCQLWRHDHGPVRSKLDG